MPDGSICEGGTEGPGLDRVIWDACAQEVCGVSPHRGRNRNLFQGCEKDATIHFFFLGGGGGQSAETWSGCYLRCLSGGWSVKNGMTKIR